MKLPKIEKTVFISDTHVPWYDRRAFKVLLQFIEDIKPERIVIMGDFLDFMSVSRWSNDPRQVVSLQIEIESAKELLDQIRQASGKKCEIVYILGNHEVRLIKYLINNADALLHLKDHDDDFLSVPHLLNLKERGIDCIPYEGSYNLHGWIFEHGNVARQHSSYTAKAMVDRRGTNVGIAHTHRAGVYYFTNYEGRLLEGVEFGCLIDRESPAAHYAKYPNWTQAFGIGEFIDGVFDVRPILFRDYKFIYNSKVYGGD